MLRKTISLLLFLLVGVSIGWSTVSARSSAEKLLTPAQLQVLQPYMLPDCIVNSEDELKNAPYVVAQAGEHLITGNGDSIYVRDLSRAYGRVYSIFRLGEVYVDPDTKKTLGYLAIHVGDARLVQKGEISTFKLMRVHREVAVGDRLLPGLYDVKPNFSAQYSRVSVRGKIIGIREDLEQTGRYRVVVINRGFQQGVRAGDTLFIYRNGEVIADTVNKEAYERVKLPDEKIGSLIVYRTFDHTSLGLVLTVNASVKLYDWVRSRGAAIR